MNGEANGGFARDSRSETMEEAQARLAAELAAREGDYQRFKARIVAERRENMRLRHIGCPVGLIADVFERTGSWAAVVLAQYIHRRVIVMKSNTVGLISAEMALIAMPESTRRTALSALAEGGFVRPVIAGRGKATVVEWLRRPSR